MKRAILTALFLMAAAMLGNTGTGAASGLRISPLIYRDTLQKNEKQKAHIDISNTTDSEVEVQTEVNGFRQVGQEGALEFFNEPRYMAGITFDYNSFKLGPRETLRLYFLLDSNKLPHGGVYAALFFKTVYGEVVPEQTSIQPIVRVGSLLVIDNGGEGKAQTSISVLRAPFFQFGSGIHASVSVENKKDEGVIAGFPGIKTSVRPFGETTQFEGPMIMPGGTRVVEVEKEGTFLGLTRISVSSDDTPAKHTWVFAVTGKSTWIIFGLLIVAGLTFAARRKMRKNNSQQR